MNKTPLTNTHIELHVPDFEQIVDFYGIFGFMVVRRNDRYLVMKRGSSILNFNEGSEKVYEQSFFKNFPQDTKRGYAVEIVIPVEDVNALYESVKDKVKVVRPLMLKRWGKKDFRVEDPFGFYLRFTEEYDWINGKQN